MLNSERHSLSLMEQKKIDKSGPAVNEKKLKWTESTLLQSNSGSERDKSIREEAQTVYIPLDPEEKKQLMKDSDEKSKKT